MATWVQCVLENPPCSGLHGGFRKTCCSQVFSCLAFSLYRQPLPSLSPDKIVNYTHMRQIEYGLRVGFYTRMQNVRRPGTQKAEPQPAPSMFSDGVKEHLILILLFRLLDEYIRRHC